MIASILAAITSWVVSAISSLGYPGVLLLMTLHSMAIPVPSEVVMPFSGYLVFTGRFNFWAVALLGTLGNLIGASVIYGISNFGGRRLILKYERALFVSARDLEQVEHFFKRFGVWAIFLGRNLPVVATFISIPAGLAKVKYWKFAFLTFFGAIIWNVFLTYIGLKLGQNWGSLRNYFHNFEILIVLVFVALAGWWLWRHFKKP